MDAFRLEHLLREPFTHRTGDIPERIFFIDELSRTPNDKFDRRALADRTVKLSQGGRR
jgi:acyl-CoA synthetase (AMP-forming)/AMP-acid ligase II